MFTTKIIILDHFPWAPKVHRCFIFNVINKFMSILYPYIYIFISIDMNTFFTNTHMHILYVLYKVSILFWFLLKPLLEKLNRKRTKISDVLT